MSNSFAKPWTVANQAPLSMGFPKQEYWSRLPFPSPEDILNVSKCLLEFLSYFSKSVEPEEGSGEPPIYSWYVGSDHLDFWLAPEGGRQ